MARKGWNEYRELVLHEVERHQTWLENLTENSASEKDLDKLAKTVDGVKGSIEKIKQDLNNLKIKIALVGVGAAGGTAGIIELVKSLAG